MGLSRREFAAMLVGASGGITLPLLFRQWQALLPQEEGRPASEELALYFRWQPQSERTWIAQGGGGNSLLYLGTQGALAVDAKGFGLGRSLVREALAHGVPVTHLVVTHHHDDHSGGSEAFRGAVRLAHENARPRILDTAAANLERGAVALSALESRLVESGASADLISEIRAMSAEIHDLVPRDFAPTRTFLDEEEIDLGNVSALALWVSQGHTDGDVYVYLPEENVLHCGDLFFHGRHPYVDVGAGATPRGWIRCIDAMLEHCDDGTVVVPGHGGTTDRLGLETQRDYFLRLQEIVERGRAEGRSREEIQMMDPGDFLDVDGGTEPLARNLGIVYDEAEEGY
jgi:glyoxylase-like metal-dependent hydrolase (beta-lactamase superfamily II)